MHFGFALGTIRQSGRGKVRRGFRSQYRSQQFQNIQQVSLMVSLASTASVLGPYLSLFRSFRHRSGHTVLSVSSGCCRVGGDLMVREP